MTILISGVCGFTGATLAKTLARSEAGRVLCGFDNFIRPGSEINREPLSKLGVNVIRADLRFSAEIDALPGADFVIDAAANPSVLAGVDGRTGSRDLIDHNLVGTVNLLEYCKRHRAGFILLSTSRVYSIPPLASLPVVVKDGAFLPALPSAALAKDGPASLPPGLTPAGIDETFSTAAPVSLYGATKLASEALALEYGEAFGFPVFINRCGVLAGAGQFGRPDQGIFAWWIHSWLRCRPLKYLGFGGKGHQVRDCLHPRDIVPLLEKQLAAPKVDPADRLANISGGAASATSLRQLSDWCAARFGSREVAADPATGAGRPYDLPWVVLDHGKAARIWGWRPQTPVAAILDEIAAHARAHPEWLDLSAPL